MERIVMDRTMAPRRILSSRAFSLLELLIVIALMLILLALAAPSMSSISQSSRLTHAAEQVADCLTLASQKAGTMNREIEVRFVQLNGNSPGLRGIQLWKRTVSPDGTTTAVPETRLMILPEGISLSSNLSPLVTKAATISGTATFGSNGSCSYRAIRVAPNGRVMENPDATQNYVSIVDSRDADASALPANNAVVQINAVTGTVTTYRP